MRARSLSGITMMGPRPIMPGTLERCREAATQRYEYHSKQPWYRGWNADSYLYGCLGEALVSALCGLPWREEFAPHGDDGTDFPSVDVKAVPVKIGQDAWLRRLASSKTWAPFYCLVAVHHEFLWARYCGYATGARLKAAPRSDFGYGLTSCLHEAELALGLPPPLRGERDG